MAGTRVASSGMTAPKEEARHPDEPIGQGRDVSTTVPVTGVTCVCVTT